MEKEESDIKTQQEEIKKLLTTAKQAISNIENNANNANRLVAVIEDYNKKFDQIRVNLDDPSSGVIANLERTKNVKAEIDTLKKSSEEQLTQIKNALATVQQNIAQMNTAHAEFTQINTKIKDPKTGLDAVLQQAGQVKSEVDTLKKSSEEQLTQIKNALATVQQNIAQMNTAYTNFVSIKTKIDDPKTGIESIFNGSEEVRQDIINVKKQSDIVFSEIKKFRDESQNYTKEIQDLKLSSEENKNTIESYEKQSEDLKGKIEKIYKIATDSGLANSFDQRKKDLEKSINKWFWIVLTSTLLLVGLIVILVLPVLSQGKSINLETWYRLTVTSPMIFFVIFATVEYGKERSYLERYAFKSATALSLEGYTTLLLNTFGDRKEYVEGKIIDFVLNAMTMIYKEPYDPVKESKMSFGVNGRIASLKADLTKTMREETAKEVVKVVKEELSKQPV
jgi:uncharacterized coiled-coil DUF342 family protein